MQKYPPFLSNYREAQWIFLTQSQTDKTRSNESSPYMKEMQVQLEAQVLPVYLTTDH